MARFLKGFFKGLRNERSLIGNIGQWCGLLTVVTGFFILAYQGQAKAPTIITAGALFFAMGTKVKHEWK
jgi:hypothetical protein